MPKIDLHCHTTASDGVLTPPELVARAKADEVDVIAVTDHDTVAGVAQATDVGGRFEVRVIAGIELSARDHLRNVHMLGYFVDPNSAELRRALQSLTADRTNRAERIVAKLNDLGYALSMADVLAEAHGDVIARPHIARAMVARGHVASVSDAFTRDFIADGGRADVPKRALTPVEAVELVRTAGGAAVLAHPGVGHHEGMAQDVDIKMLTRLRDAGMAGLETEHPDHPPLLRDKLRAIASDLGLIATGGSDFHGDSGQYLGRCVTTQGALEALEASCR